MALGRAIACSASCSSPCSAQWAKSCPSRCLRAMTGCPVRARSGVTSGFRISGFRAVPCGRTLPKLTGVQPFSLVIRSCRVGVNLLHRPFRPQSCQSRHQWGHFQRVLIRLEQDVLALDPAAIILLIGTNDLEERASPEVIAANVSLILEAVVDFSPTLPVVLCDVMPSSSAMNRPTGQIQQVNALLAELAGDYQNVIPFDTFSLFADDEGNAKPAEFPDLLHPNETAYLRWATPCGPC